MNSFLKDKFEDIAFWRWWGLGLMIVLALTLAIRSESFWIDELSSAFLASQKNWEYLIKVLRSLGSEAQMPLHVVWLWFWSHYFGTGEWALRASNIPWAILAIFVWMGLLRKIPLGPWAMALLISPFICYYMNEARPYVMTFAASMVSLYAVESLCVVPAGSRGAKYTVALVAGVGLCAGASMLNLIIVPSLIAYVVMRMSGADYNSCRLKHWMCRYAGTLGCLFVLLTGITGYYLVTLMQGHGGQRESFTWINAAYAIYEMIGFGGLGAPRILLREISVSSILSEYGVTLIGGLIVWGWAGWVIWTRRRVILRDPVVRASLTSLAVGILTLTGAAVLFKVSLWGRHFMVMMPLMLLGLTAAMEIARKGAPLMGKFAIMGLIGLFAVSSIRQRVIDDYRKDPIREAMDVLGAFVQQSPDMPVVLVTSPMALWYSDRDIKSVMTPVFGWPDARSWRWQSNHPQYFIMLHRADKFDPREVWTNSLKGRTATLLWHEGNIKIFRVGSNSGVKGLL